jgi:hypothetical protein
MMDARKLVALVTELCDNVRDGLLSAGTAADAIAAAASGYQPAPAVPDAPLADDAVACGVPMTHEDGSVGHCTLPRGHQRQIEDSDHYDEHGCIAAVLISQSTIREVAALQAWRDEHPEEP